MGTSVGPTELLAPRASRLKRRVSSHGKQVTARSPLQLFWRRFRKDKVAMVAAGFVVLACPRRDLRAADRQGRRRARPERPEPGPARRLRLALRARPPRTGSASTSAVATCSRASSTAPASRSRSRSSRRPSSCSSAWSIGLIAGYYRGSTDSLLTRAMDVMLAFPVLLLAIGLGVACADGCLSGIDPARPDRRGDGHRPLPVAVHGAHRPRPGAVAAREGVRRGGALARRLATAGSSSARSSPTSSRRSSSTATILIPQVILFEAALSFLGIGIEPGTPSWGSMISDAVGVFDIAWWFMTFPGLALAAHRPRLQPRRRRPAGRAESAYRQVIQLEDTASHLMGHTQERTSA